MTYNTTTQCVAFSGTQMLASGSLAEVATTVKQAFDQDPSLSAWIFEATSSARIDLDLAGSQADVLARIPAPPATPIRGPGRPKLGVVPREVTLLPRHWEWLSTQPGGASVALRKLVEAARKTSSAADDRRKGQDAIYKFMTAVAGDFEGYEEATRALYAHNQAAFMALIEAWPEDVFAHLSHLTEAAFASEEYDV
jgi:uncharacterized protein